MRSTSRIRRPSAAAVIALGVAILGLACGGRDDLDVLPSGPTDSLAAAPRGGGGATVTWANPADADLGRVVLVRYAQGAALGEPDGGRTYAVGDAIGGGVVVYVGLAEIFDDPAATGCVTYQTWTQDVNLNWSVSSELVTTGTGVAGPPSAAPSGLTATVGATSVQLAWVNPAAATGHDHVRILRKTGSAPASAVDGTLVHSGSGIAAADALTALVPDVETFYAAFSCNACGDCEATGIATSFTPTVVECLRGGGYVIHFRHAAASVCADRLDLGTADVTVVPDWWKSCDADCATATARQLTAQGVTDATNIANDMRARGIPVSRVISSEFCRNVGTAEAMAFGPAIEQDQGLTFFVHDEPGRCASTAMRLAEAPPAGGNTVLIGHAGFTGPCAPMDALLWGESAIFRPDGAGGSVLVRAKVGVGEWPTLP